MSEQFCLKWNDFKENITSSFNGLRKDADFSDVTLVCEEDKQVEAHRIILTACSPFFSSVLKRNKHPHPMIYMRGLKANDLVAIVDFIYYGEANIYQEDLDGFLALAEELQLKGLTGSQNDSPELAEEAQIKQKEQHLPHKSMYKQETDNELKSNIENKTIIPDNIENHSIVPIEAVNIHVAAGTSVDALRVKLDSMMERIDDGDYRWKCTICGKTTKGEKSSRDMRRHIETHMDGLSFPCNQCGTVSRSSNALNLHVSKYHRK